MTAPAASLAFWPASPERRVASTRIRCLQMIDALRDAGAAAGLYAPGQPPPSVLVLAKRYDDATLDEALRVRRVGGTRLVLDLCDNHFHADHDDPKWRVRADRLRRACAEVDRVVVSTEPLAAVVRAECGAATPLTVIPDGLDLGAADPDDRGRHDALHALRQRAFSAWHRVAVGRRLLWFGNHGFANAGGGLEDLARIAPALSRHHAAAPLALLVVSNRWRSFRAVARGWRFPALYLPWSGANFARALAASDIALIPAQRNPFTVCKTNNRLATASMHGLAVAADALPSYEDFRDLAVLDDWDAGLAGLMGDAADRSRRIAAAQARLQATHAPARIASRWQALAEELCGLPAQSRP